MRSQGGAHGSEPPGPAPVSRANRAVEPPSKEPRPQHATLLPGRLHRFARAVRSTRSLVVLGVVLAAVMGRVARNVTEQPRRTIGPVAAAHGAGEIFYPCEMPWAPSGSAWELYTLAAMADEEGVGGHRGDGWVSLHEVEKLQKSSRSYPKRMRTRVRSQKELHKRTLERHNGETEMSSHCGAWVRQNLFVKQSLVAPSNS